MKKNYNSNYIGLFQKTAFSIDFWLWEVPTIDNDDDDNDGDDDYDDDDDDDYDDDDDDDYDVFSSS